MTKSKSSIFKKITLGLSTIICTCALYSAANAGEEIIDNNGFIVSQEEAPRYAVYAKNSVDNMPDYKIHEVKEGSFKKSLASRKVPIIASALVAIIVGIIASKTYTKHKLRKGSQQD